MDENEDFSIRQMVELTGLTEFTIRGWENRYKAFKPLRGATGRRKYQKEDVEKALLLRELLKRGHKISQIAQSENSELLYIFEQTEAFSKNQKAPYKTDLILRALELMALQKWLELKNLIRVVSAKDSLSLIHDFFLPAIQGLIANVEAGVVSISQEHIFSSFLKEKIYSALTELESKYTINETSEYRFVLAAPEGDHHDLGLLLAHLMIRSYGFTSLYLGPHTPSKDLSETALRFDATHILIVSTVSKAAGARQELLTFVSDVNKKVGGHLQILVAGSQAPMLTQNSSASTQKISSFVELESFLKTMSEPENSAKKSAKSGARRKK